MNNEENQQQTTDVQSQEGQQEQQNQDTGSKVTFTDEQQAAINDLVAEKLAKERAKAEAKAQEAAQKAEQEKEDAIKKAEQRAKMSAEERAEAERKDREQAIEQERQELARQKQEFKTKSMLLDKGITSDMLPLLMGANDDETSQRMDLLNKYVAKKVQEATEKLMRGKQTPTGGNGVSLNDNPWSAQAFNLTKQQEIFNQDPEKARQMIAQAQPKQGFYVGKIN
ncbi:DUF4355 domain-containing protein [Limosilactobacillus vaginalis]|uniref:DUF4355 domain-containing protein n=1 Tax=Limosilactobacillus vaginalis TaxID=1633 RepID=UPI002072C4AB|nr:DUF4355 domain-containing protein [Limosilactobacillus vaginalis]